MSDDKKEWGETLELLEEGHDTVLSDLTIGKYVSLSQELFETMIQEINDNRIKNGNLDDGIDLIMVSEDENTESDV